LLCADSRKGRKRRGVIAEPLEQMSYRGTATIIQHRVVLAER
jgi:hypothetical protein